MKQFIFTLTFIISSASGGSADVFGEYISLTEEIKAQSECSSYVGFFKENYTIAGFEDEADMWRATNRHIEKAITAAQKFITLTSQNDIDGQRLIYKKAGKSCIGELCFPSLDFIASMLLMGGIDEGQKKITEKPIPCPANVWTPCYGSEQAGNWAHKASNLYKSKNCRLLLR